MGFALNPTYAESEKSSLASKKCVWEIFSESGEFASGNRLGSKGLSRKNAPTPTKHASGRTVWLSRDPIAENGGINLYAYVHNNPIRYWDPNGLASAENHAGKNIRRDPNSGLDPNSTFKNLKRLGDAVKQGVADKLGNLRTGLSAGVSGAVNRCTGVALQAIADPNAPEAMKNAPNILKDAQFKKDLIDSMFEGSSASGDKVQETIERHQNR